MKVQQLLFKTEKKAPADCIIESQSLMMRGGYIKPVGTGVFSMFPATKRIAHKIETIMREEMDRIDGQEVLFPVVMPGALWQESGRFDSIGSELLRFKDRNGIDMVLGMTHEEAAVQIVRDVAQSYAKYPFMIYQIQTKFRDEPRSRGGLIRTREFTMKDAYSFHTSQEDLEKYYEICYHAYERIFARCGVPEVVAVKSDSGMMGGRVSHEFMLLTDIGEDTIVICPECNYRSNMEAADCIVENAPCGVEELAEVHTPGYKTIEEVCTYLKKPAINSCKAVLYQRNVDDSLVIVFLRGDLDVNETKLKNHLKADIHPAIVTEEMGVCAGYIGPKGLPEGVTVVYDESLRTLESFVAGANKTDYHYVGMNMARDIGDVEYVSVAKAFEGGICPVCGKHSIKISRGIEVGNIFQLGTKYTESMGLQYLDSNGELQCPIMGCYGIGVGRLIASVCQVRRDKFGPIWPITIAPWQVQLCALRVDDENVRKTADKLYEDLKKLGVEVIYDDRNIGAGSMFADADLIGVPLRAVVSPRTLERGAIELSARDKSFTVDLTADNAAELIKAKVTEMINAISNVD
ncbi:MAG: proline--tRNA ligase [Ruminococcaceae bacterium]|nr:proline--tRNA ligase [Oscillospiraceae bacterium]